MPSLARPGEVPNATVRVIFSSRGQTAHLASAVIYPYVGPKCQLRSAETSATAGATNVLCSIPLKNKKIKNKKGKGKSLPYLK